MVQIAFNDDFDSFNPDDEFNTDISSTVNDDDSSLDSLDSLMDNLDSTSDFGEFSNNNSAEEQPDKKKILKTIFIPCIIGVIVIVAILLIVPIILNSSKKEPSKEGSNSSKTHTEQQIINQTENSEDKQINSNVNLSEWISFAKSDVSFNEDMITSTFTVVDIKHFVKVASSTNEIQVKSVLTGNLSGFIGTYEIEVPYYKGSLLSIGNSFSVEVQIGDYNGNRVVGEIKY